jgi:hypothetical protein
MQIQKYNEYSIQAVSLINSKQYDKVIRNLAPDIYKAQNCSPIQNLINNGASKKEIVNTVAILILKYGNLLNVSGNLKEGQALAYAEIIVETFPGMSIDDINLALKYGCTSQYGQVYRYDISVISDWMHKYNDKFYQIKEEQIRKQKEELDKTEYDIPVTDREKIDKYLNQLLEEISKIQVKNARPISDAEIKQEGQEKPQRQSYHFDEEYAITMELRRQWMRETYDKRIEGPSISFEEWLMIDKNERQ